MRRYWIEKKMLNHDIVTFKDEVFHHVFDVCRQDVGSHFEVLTEDSKAYLVKVLTKEKKQATAQVLESREIQKLPKPHVHIALSISRYHVMDSIFEKAVEMGVTSILPFFSDFSFVRKAGNLPDSKMDRWQKIVISATQQSGRGELMKIHKPIEWSKMLESINQSPANRCLFAYEGDGTMGIKDYLIQIKNNTGSLPENIWLIIGSEGGFSDAEVAEMKKLGLDPVTLGSQILRVETACMTLVFILKYEFELLK